MTKLEKVIIIYMLGKNVSELLLGQNILQPDVS
jgi:hypothetical protein